MAARHEFSASGIVAFCDDLRERAPKQTALAIRYFLEIAADPRKTASHYHQAIMGEQNYSHGNTIIRGLASLHYLQIARPRQPGDEDRIDLTPAWKKKLAVAKESHNKIRGRRLMDIQIAVDDTESQVYLASPYHPDMPAMAKAAGGKWNGEVWAFPLAADAEVRRICLEVYGEDGTPQPRVTIRCQASDALVGTPAKSIFLAGRKVASTKGAESGVLLGDAITVIEGGFVRKEEDKGAAVVAKQGTVFEICDLPVLAAERLQDQHPDDVEVISEPAPASTEAQDVRPTAQHSQAISDTAPGVEEEKLVPLLRQSLQEAREDILRLCEAHGLPWPDAGLAKYQRVIDKARVSELKNHG